MKFKRTIYGFSSGGILLPTSPDVKAQAIDAFLRHNFENGFLI
jgi:hypothetical protein